MLTAVTQVVGLKGAEGVVLASDSQATHGDIRTSQPKLFKTKYGVIWGSAGPFAGTQDLFTAMEANELEENPRREEAKAAIQDALLTTAGKLTVGSEQPPSFEALFAWYDATDERHYLLHGLRDGRVEFEHRYGSIGVASSLGRFGFARSEFLELETLPLELTKMMAHMVAEDVVRASAKGVDLPIQLAVVSHGETHVLRGAEAEAVSDAVGAFREAQRELLVTAEPPREGAPRKGIRPGER
jgi:20S proteasome alpha/beta subunit